VFSQGCDVVVLSALAQNSSSEKYIQISITVWNLHLPGNHGLQQRWRYEKQWTAQSGL